MSEEIPLTLLDVTYLYQASTGKLTVASHLRQLNIFNWNLTTMSLHHPIIFHAISMYSWEEIRNKISLNDVMSELATQHQVLQAMGVSAQPGLAPHDAARGAITGIMNKGFFGFLSGLDVSFWQLWVFL